MVKSNSVSVQELSSTPTYILLLNQVMNLSVCLASDPSLSVQYRDIFAGVAASASLVLDSINRYNGK